MGSIEIPDIGLCLLQSTAPTFMLTRVLQRLIMTVNFVAGVRAAHEEMTLVDVGGPGRHLNVVTVDTAQAVTAVVRLADFSCRSYCHSAKHIDRKKGAEVGGYPHR